jgi:hypothetical protein
MARGYRPPRNIPRPQAYPKPAVEPRKSAVSIPSIAQSVAAMQQQQAAANQQRAAAAQGGAADPWMTALMSLAGAAGYGYATDIGKQAAKEGWGNVLSEQFGYDSWTDLIPDDISSYFNLGGAEKASASPLAEVGVDSASTISSGVGSGGVGSGGGVGTVATPEIVSASRLPETPTILSGTQVTGPGYGAVATDIGGMGPVASGAQYGGMLEGASAGANIGPVASGAEYAGMLQGASAAEGGGFFGAGGLGAQGGTLSNLGAAAGAYGMYDIVDRWGEGDRSAGGVARGLGQGAASGALIGYRVGGPYGAIAGAIIGGLTGLTGTLVKTGKHEDQIKRDKARDKLAQRGLATMIDGSHHILLPGGATFDIGKDGDALMGQDAEGNEYRWYDTTPEQMRNPLFANVGKAILPIMYIAGEKNPQIAGQMANYLTHAAMQSADPKGTLVAWYRHLFPEDPEINRTKIIEYIGRNYEMWGMSLEEAQATQNALNYLFQEGYDVEAADLEHQKWMDIYLQDFDYAAAKQGQGGGITPQQAQAQAGLIDINPADEDEEPPVQTSGGLTL